MAAITQGNVGGASTPPRCNYARIEDLEPPSAPRRRMKPPLLKAIQQGSIAQVKFLLGHCGEDARIQLQAGDGIEPALCFAVRSGLDEKMMQTLLEYGADANDLGTHGRSALGFFCDEQFLRTDSADSMGNLAVMFEGVATGLVLPFFCCEHQPSLMFAGLDRVSLNIPSSVSILLGDADILPQKATSQAAAKAQRLRLGTLLLAAGADPDACDFTGATPVMLARKSGKQQLAFLVEFYRIAQVIFSIGRVLSTSEAKFGIIPAIGRIDMGILLMICEFFAPEGSEATLSRISKFAMQGGDQT